MHSYDVNKLYSQNQCYQHTRMMLIYYDAIKIVIYTYAIVMFTKYAFKWFAKLYVFKHTCNMLTLSTAYTIIIYKYTIIMLTNYTDKTKYL